MTTQICIDSAAGQDCLEFTPMGKSPFKKWHLNGIHSKRNMNTKRDGQNSNAIRPVIQVPFYVEQSAYGSMV